ncbi:MAG: hypothetical protein ACYS6K_21650 [Planctomycetota bacterium]|jgi:hypothetical protein
MRKIIKLIMVCLVVIFTTNAYAGYVVYDSGGTQSAIQQAMTDLGLTVDVVRGPGDPVTAADLVGAEALIVGWNMNGNMSGLETTGLFDGITGNILITGHDADYHTVNSSGDIQDDATLFLRQAISFASSSSGTGLVVLGDSAYQSTPWYYLPDEWGISAVEIAGDEPVTIEAAGRASGVYDGLIDSDMSPWGQSYHSEFTAYGSRFEVFENHSSTKAITIGHVVPVPAAVLLGIIGLSVAGVKLRKHA